MTTNVNQFTDITETAFTAEEARTLEALHSRYQADHDLFNPRELAHLRFLRWRIETGRLRAHRTALASTPSHLLNTTREDRY